MEKMMRLSVIIPTRNRARLLEGTLASIVAQNMDKGLFEVIVVDNGSTDNTATVCEKFASEINLRCIHALDPGLHVGRHAGLHAAASDILVYADDDIEAMPSWLATIDSVFTQDPSIVLVGGKNLPKFEAPPPFWIMEMWNERIEHGHVLYALSILDFGESARAIPPHFVFGCNFSVRKQVVLEAGGFHPDGIPFELIRFRGDGESHISTYIQQQGLKAWYHPQASVLHVVTPERLTHEYFQKRHYIQGVSDAYTQLRNRSTPAASRKPVGRTFFALWKHRLKILLGMEQLKLIREQNEVMNNLFARVNRTDFEKQCENSYRKGYAYLMSCYKADSEIAEWVHKENYL